MLQGIIVLLFFQLCGEALVGLSGISIPGSVVGMLILWICLHLKGRVPDSLNQASQGLIKHLSLLFLPAGAGLFFLPPSVQKYWPAVMAAIVVGTFISLLFSSWLVKQLAPKGDS